MRRESGFSFVEAIVSLGILATSLLGLGAVFTQGMKMISGSSGDLVMTQKATEAIESVFTARDTRVLTWGQICNVGATGSCSNGVFKTAALPVKNSGPDGLINTDDDTTVETAVLPGRDNQLNTADDETISLDAYTRQITITDMSPGLRQIRVTVTYQDGSTTREYTLVSFISTYA
jgi:hypothetical protein